MEEQERGQRGGRREPDWERLRMMIDEGCRRLGLLNNGKPAYRQLGTRLKQQYGSYETAVYNIIDRTSWPGWEFVTTLADLFGEDQMLWLEAAGLISSPTGGRMTPQMHRALRIFAGKAEREQLAFVHMLEAAEEATEAARAAQ